MIIAQLNGGLGNQLFQYAAAKSLAKHHGVALKLDVSSFYRDTLPDLEVPRAFELYNFIGIDDEIIRLDNQKNDEIIRFLKRKSLSKLLPNHRRKIYSEPFYHFDPNFFNSKKNVLLRGQWQSEKYFIRNEGAFRRAFQLKPELIAGCAAIGQSLSDKQSVAVHVRRADYLRKQIILEWHGVLDKDYYEAAFELLNDALSSYEVFYFTDDPSWVISELLPLKQGTIVSLNTANHYEDLYLMSNCRHNVIANSSFSWWAGWLNNHPDKIVIGPKRWFHHGPKDTYDVLPESWIKI